MLVARAVFPIEGLPAIINKSDLCKPPSLSSKSFRPVGTPTIPSSFLYAAEAISESRKLDFTNLKAGFSHIPGENLERGIGPGGVRAAVFENIINDKKELTSILLWDANGLAPGMNEELQQKLQGKVDNLLISTTDNHFVNIKPGGFNPLSDSEGLLASANQVLDEAISDISDAESAMGTVYVLSLIHI